MLDQTYSKKSLIKYLRKTRISGLTVPKRDSLIDSLDKVVSEINKKEFDFNSLNSFEVKNKRVWRTKSHKETLILRLTNSLLKKIFKVKQANRNLITNQITNLISSGQSYYILRTDIKNFYESVPYSKILKQIESDHIFSVQLKYILKKIKDKCLSQNKGLPRGICFSPTLAERFLREFDDSIRQNDSVFYYGRYVDDIIIFYKNNDKFNLKKLKEYLPFELALNESKTIEFILNCRCHKFCICGNNCKCSNKCKCKYDATKDYLLEYLGYNFTFSDIPINSDKAKEVKITLATSKIKKMKTRIVLAVLDYLKSNNFNLLEKRIQFLTSNYPVYETIENSNLKAGIYYSYPMINKFEDLDNLDVYLKKLIFSKNNSLGNKINAALDETEKQKIVKFSFKYGHIERRLAKFSAEDIDLIKKCWKNG